MCFFYSPLNLLPHSLAGVVTYFNSFFLQLSGIPLYGYITSIHLLMAIWAVYLLAISDKVAVNICV